MWYPIFLDIKRQPVLVVGGGETGNRKAQTLLNHGASVTVISPEHHLDLVRMRHRSNLKLIKRKIRDSDIAGHIMVILATPSAELNRHLSQLARRQCVLVNSVDDLANCGFIVPAIARQGPLTVAISSSGKSPSIAQRLRDKIQSQILTPSVGELTEFLGVYRNQVKNRIRGYGARRRFWHRILDSPLPRLIGTRQYKEAHISLIQWLRATEEEQ